MAADFQYDVFFSHSARDKAVVRPLAERLREDGVKVWFDEWVLKPGDSIPARIEEGLEHSCVLVLCMSANAFGSDWAQLESGTFRFRDPLNKERRFIPLRLDDAPIKGSLAQFLYINWLPVNREQEYAKLLEACRGGKTLRVDSPATAGWQTATTNEIVPDRETRGDFPQKVKDTLARRVGFLCSNPACRCPTIGPHSDPNKAINVGVAAHIAAAAKGGPRYDPKMSRAERTSISNGIWLCQNCAKLIDNDEMRYTADLLRQWKTVAEQSALRSIETSTPSELVAEPIYCPYPGMVPFRPEDARFFYGREREIENMLQRLRHQRFLLIIGPSGSGKSSLVSAGLLPRLTKSGYFQQGFWMIREMRPGNQAMQSLRMVIMGNSAHPAPTLSKLLTHNAPAHRLLLVVDQFEELFTQNDRFEQGRFIASLKGLHAADKCAVIILLRADFYVELMNSDLWPLSEGERIEIVPLQGEFLSQAIERPGAVVGVSLEPALLERLLADAGGDEPGVLPHVQEAMRVLWEKMERRLLTLAAYKQLSPDGRSGLAVAMSIKADATMKELSVRQQDIVRRVFLRLVQFGENRPDTRRQQSEADLRSADDDPQLFRKTLEHLASNRLLTITGEESRADKRVDIAHEALIKGWPLLNKWLVESREAEKKRRRLEDKAAGWVQLGRGTGGLLDKDQLAEAETWLAEVTSRNLGISKDFRELLDFSREHNSEPIQNNWLTREALDKLLANAAEVIAVKRQLRKMGLRYESQLISTQEEMLHDFQQARASLVSDILGGKLDLLNHIAPDSYRLLEEVWLEEIKRFRAASFHEDIAGQNDPERDYFEAGQQMRRLLFTRSGAQPGQFRNVKVYLEDRYLAHGRLDEGKSAAHWLIGMKARKIWERSGHQDSDRNWACAKMYVKMFYENILGAVLHKDQKMTARILKAFEFSKSPVNRFFIIDAFEAVIAINFLDKEVLNHLRKTPSAFNFSIVSVDSWPPSLTSRESAGGEFRYDKASGQIIYEGEMSESERDWFLAHLEKESGNNEALRAALEHLYEQSQMRPFENMML